MEYTLQHSALQVSYTPEACQLSVLVKEAGKVWSWSSTPYVQLTDQRRLNLTEGECRSRSFDRGTTCGVYATYSHLRDDEGRPTGLSVETEVSLCMATGRLKVTARVMGDGEGEVSSLFYPPRMGFAPSEGRGYTVLPRMQGTLLPAGHGYTLDDGVIFERAAYIPVFGQVWDGCGYAVIVDTPFDARYRMAGEELQVYFIPSLGVMAYPRTLLYSFFPKGDFNTIGKTYRTYLKERGELVTLKEKIARNPKVAYLLGCPIVHTCAAVHIHPASHYYDHRDPGNNDHFVPFEETERRLRLLKQRGLEKAYLHLDGWGHHGYDNLHPEPFPIHEGAGGAQGLRALQHTCTQLGFFFGLHDQYRDYYYDSPHFDLDNALMDLQGNHPYQDFWYGGPHSFLCAELAMEYVRQSYDEFERLGIHIDGSYLDVFSVVGLDECFHPHHPMTRRGCARARARCLNLLNDRGIIPSSEETMGCMVNAIALCHHAPFYTSDWEDQEHAENLGIPIPFFSLVYNDCVVVPWQGLRKKGGWGIAGEDRGFYWALLCGGTIYCDVDATSEDIAYGKVALELHRRVALCELISHELIDGHPRRRRSTFSDGTVVEVDMENEVFHILYPEGDEVSGG